MVKATYKSPQTKTTDITPEFTSARLTNYGGLVPFAEFLLEKLRFPEALGQQLDLEMGPNCSYRDWQIFGLIVFGYLCGYDRLAHFEELSRDLTVQGLLGLDGPIDENTLAYRLKKVAYKHSVQLQEVSGALAAQVHRADPCPRQGNQWIDFDSTVKRVYGDQEGAAKGFNPARKGGKSYHPLGAFDGASKECIHSWWRTGAAYTGNGAGGILHRNGPAVARAGRLLGGAGRQRVLWR